MAQLELTEAFCGPIQIVELVIIADLNLALVFIIRLVFWILILILSKFDQALQMLISLISKRFCCCWHFHAEKALMQNSWTLWY